MTDQDRHECEVSSQLWDFEERYRPGNDYLLKNDPDYIEWLEEKRKRDLLYQMRDSHQTEETS